MCYFDLGKSSKKIGRKKRKMNKKNIDLKVLEKFANSKSKRRGRDLASYYNITLSEALDLISDYAIKYGEKI